MNFDFAEKEKVLCDKLAPLLDPDAEIALRQLQNEDLQRTRDLLLHWMQKLGQTGFLTLGLEDGKNSAGLVAAQEGLAAAAPSLFLSVEVSARIFGRLISVYGTPEQRAEILPALREGRLIGTVGLSEMGMNIEHNPLQTTGVLRDNGFHVSGSKCHVMNAPIADFIAVAAKVNDQMAFFLVERGSEGLLAGERTPTLGYEGVIISSMMLEHCLVPSKFLIGPFEDIKPLRTVRTWEDQVLTAASLGLIKSSFDAALKYAKLHRSGDKPIIAYQEIGFKLAEMLTLLQTAQLLAYRAAWFAETEDREADVLARCAKVFCTESAEVVASSALQIMGEQGYRSGNAAEEGYRNAKYLQIAGTSTEISRVTIGDDVLERN
jgi:alkylation response protein AidB-like acyl-CoA dehydrogenase